MPLQCYIIVDFENYMQAHTQNEMNVEPMVDKFRRCMMRPCKFLYKISYKLKKIIFIRLIETAMRLEATDMYRLL